MAEIQSRTPGRSKTFKLALIPVLAGLLALLLLWPDDKHQPQQVAARPIQSISSQGGTLAATVGETNSQPASKVVKRHDKLLPEMEIEEILRHNPFALPPALGDLFWREASQPPAKLKNRLKEAVLEEKQDQRERHIKQLIADLLRQGVTVVLQNKDGSSAVIGKRVVREGDSLEEGVRIVEIRPEGIILEVEGN